MKHVLFAHRKLSFGGGERVLVEQIASLAGEAVEISILYRKDPERRDVEKEIRSRHPRIKTIECCTSFWSFYGWLKKYKPDLVVLCNHRSAHWALWLLRLQGIKIPLWVTLHEHYPRHLKKYWGIRGLVNGWICTYDFEISVRRILGDAPCVIMHPVYSQLNLWQPKIVSAEDRLLARQKFHIEKDAFVMGYCGQVDTRKDPHAFIQLGVYLEQWMQRPVTLLIAGRVGDSLSSSIKSFAKKQGLRGSLIITGALEHFEDAFRCLDIFALTSRNEGFFPISLIEALYYRIPIVAPTVGGIESVARGHRGVFLIEKEDDRQNITDDLLNSMARKISQAIVRPSQWQQEKESTQTLLASIKNTLEQQPKLREVLKAWL